MDKPVTTELSFMPSSAPKASGDDNNVSVKTVNAGEVSVKVERVHVDGVGRTKDDVVLDSSYVRELLAATNLQQTIFLALLVKQHYDQLGIFKRCKIYIDTSKGEFDSPDGIDITFKCKEYRRVGGGVSTAITSANEPSLSTSLKLANVWGRAENFNLEYSYGSKRSQNFQAIFSKPVWQDLEARVNVGVYQSSGESPWSAYTQRDRAVFTNLTWSSALPVTLTHTVQWDLVWRHMAAQCQATPFDIRAQCGHTLKESLKYSITHDTRDNPVMPLDGGWMWRVTNELAGLALGNVSYLKTTLDAQCNQTLPLDSLLQGNLSLGQVSSWDLNKPPLITDMYHLGGPLTFRGFQLNRIGSTMDGFSPGANTFWNAGLHLYTPLPFRPGRGGFGDFFKTHLFLNAGNLCNLGEGEAGGGSRERRVNELRRLFARDLVRASCGAGIVFVFGGVMRLELNYCWPLAAREHDNPVHGFQFGIGATYT